MMRLIVFMGVSPRRRVSSADLVALHAPLLAAVGEAICAQRRARKLTQQELADRCGVQRAYLSALEHGTRNPTLITLSRITDELGWSLTGLMHDANV